MSLDWNEVVGSAVNVVVGVIVGTAVGSLGTAWRARRRDAQWTLQRITGEDWTLRRDSPKTALAVRIWEDGVPKLGEVHFTEGSADNDLERGESISATGIKPGVRLNIAWIESDRRRLASLIVREGIDTIEVLRKDVQ